MAKNANYQGTTNEHEWTRIVLHRQSGLKQQDKYTLQNICEISVDPWQIIKEPRMNTNGHELFYIGKVD